MRYTYLLSLIVLLLISCSTDSSNDKAVDDDEYDDEYYDEEEMLFEGEIYFWGHLDDQHEIYMFLDLPIGDSGDIEGTYYYKTQQKEISLRGVREGDHFLLDEYVGDEITGHFDGSIGGAQETIFSGTWSNNQSEMEMVLYAWDSGDYYKNLNEERPQALSWEELKNEFEPKELPIDVGRAEEGTTLDTNTVKKYFAIDDEWLDTDYIEYYPMYLFEYNDQLAFVLQYYYSPGVFGINNVFSMLYTYTKEGRLIDAESLGCYCNDTNMGANDYYSNDDFISINEDGTIDVERISIHATLFEEEAEESEIFDERDTTYSSYQLQSNGQIVEIK